MKKRVLIFHPTIAPYRIDFFNALNSVFETRVCLYYQNLKSKQGSFKDYKAIRNKFEFVPVYLKERLRVRDRSFVSGFCKHIRDFNPDIVIIDEFGLSAIWTIAFKKIFRKNYKIISICDDNYNMVTDNNDFTRLHRKMREWVVPEIDDIILVEPKVTEWYNKKYGKGIFFPIIQRYSTNRASYENALLKSKEYADKYQLNHFKSIFLFVGRFVSVKNVATIIKAYQKLNDDKAALILVGDGPDRDDLQQMAFGNKGVIFTGRLEGEELKAWYNLADCFILASNKEPFGAVTNEALMGGCFALVSKHAGSACLIVEGKNGHVFNPNDKDELAERMSIISRVNHTRNLNQIRQDKNIFNFDSLFSSLVREINNMM